MKNSREKTQFYQDLSGFGFTEAEIEEQVQKDVQAAAKEIEKHLFTNRDPMLIRWVLAALQGKDAPRCGISQESFDFHLNYIGDVLNWYPEKFHSRIIEAIYRDLPDYEIEFNEEEDEQRALDEWNGFIKGKTLTEIRALIAKVKIMLNAGRRI